VGYAYSVYTVDLKALRKLWGRGKKNNALGEEIREELEEDIADNWEAFEDDIIEHGAPLVARAMYEIFAGKPEKKEHGFQYGYALELIVQHIGQRVDDEQLTWFDDVLDPLLKKARCPNVEQMMGRGTLPLKIPMPDDFPEIGTVEPAGCIAAIGALATIRPMTKNDNALMVIDEVRGWFEAAKKMKRGLVWFIY
jgi:hypothetical protein